jgi:hypothetical protein
MRSAGLCRFRALGGALIEWSGGAIGLFDFLSRQASITKRSVNHAMCALAGFDAICSRSVEIAPLDHVLQYGFRGPTMTL